MDWTAFFEGYSVGTFQMLCVDAVILVIIWPLRQFIGILKDPSIKRKILILLGADE